MIILYPVPDYPLGTCLGAPHPESQFNKILNFLFFYFFKLKFLHICENFFFFEKTDIIERNLVTVSVDNGLFQICACQRRPRRANGHFVYVVCSVMCNILLYTFLCSFMFTLLSAQCSIYYL